MVLKANIKFWFLQLGETEVYVTDLKDLKDHVIIQQGDEQLFAEGNVLNITTDGTVPKTEVRQIVVDGAVLTFFFSNIFWIR